MPADRSPAEALGGRVSGEQRIESSSCAAVNPLSKIIFPLKKSGSVDISGRPLRVEQERKVCTPVRGVSRLNLVTDKNERSAKSREGPRRTPFFDPRSTRRGEENTKGESHFPWAAARPCADKQFASAKSLFRPTSTSLVN